MGVGFSIASIRPSSLPKTSPPLARSSGAIDDVAASFQSCAVNERGTMGNRDQSEN
jgi:hypothetical protein